MKKRVISLFVVMVVLSTIVQATADSIYEYLQSVDENYFLVVGKNGKGGDTLAAIDVAIGLKNNNPSNVDIEPIVEDEVPSGSSKILIGHPCDNTLMQISCTDWPYKSGEALIAVTDNDLVIAGTTVEDTRRAAKVILDYPKYGILRTELKIIVTGKGLFPRTQNIQKAKSAEEFVCGDKICEPGEGVLCFIDCAQLSCFDLCQQEGFSESACRDKKSNPAVANCEESEEDRGDGYCAAEKVCCCKKQEQNIQPRQSAEPSSPAQETQIKPSSNQKTLLIVFFISLGMLAVIGIFLVMRKPLQHQ
mgnify:FL=1